jgi:hypothetical protein
MKQAKNYFPEQAGILDEIACCFDRTSNEHMENFVSKVRGEPIRQGQALQPRYPR